MTKQNEQKLQLPLQKFNPSTGTILFCKNFVNLNENITRTHQEMR